MAAGRVIGEAFVAVKPDASAFGAQLQRDAQKAINNLSQQLNQGVGGAIDAAGEKASGLGGHLKGLAATAAGLFAGVQVGQFLKAGIDQAADLGESINAIKVTLGPAADSFLEFGKTAADSLGITQAELNQALIPMASLLANAGLAGEALSGNLQDVATRATDVASVFNKDVNEVLAAFGAAVRGETEPIRALGVNFDEAAVAAKAVELGLAASTKEVDNAAKTQARLALIMEQTNRAAGDFANTSNSLPNLMKRFTATLDETKGALGQGLLPILSETLQSLLPAVTGLVPVFAEVGKALIPVVRGIGGAIERLAPLAVTVLEAFTTAFEPLGGIILSLAEAVAPLLGTFANLVSTVLGPLISVFAALVIAAEPVISFFVSFINVALDAFGPALQSIAVIINDLAAVFVDAMGALSSEGNLQDVFEALSDVLGELAPVIVQTAQLVAGTLGDAFKVAAPILAEVIRVVAQFVAEVLRGIMPVLPRLADAFGELMQALLPLLPVFGELVAEILPPLAPVLPAMAEAFVAIVEALLPLVPVLVDVITFLAPMTPMILALVAIFGTISTPGGFIFGIFAIVAGLQQLLPILADVGRAIGGFFADAFGFAIDAIVGFLKFYFSLPMTIYNTALNIGKALINGIVNGVSALLGYIADIGRAIGNTLIDSFNVVIRLINDFIPNSVGVGPVSLDLPDNPLPRIPRLARGGITVDEGLYWLHPKEAVVPLNSANGQAALAAAAGDTGGEGMVIFQEGAVQIIFQGVVPTEAEAKMVATTAAQTLAEEWTRNRRVMNEARRVSGG